MYLIDLAKIIYEEGAGSENRKITVRTHGVNAETLWCGEAKDLKAFAESKRGWIVVEILIDNSDDATCNNEVLPDYNRGKIITVI